MRKTCLDTVYELAKKDKKILFIGSDLGPGVLDDFKKNMPKFGVTFLHKNLPNFWLQFQRRMCSILGLHFRASVRGPH